MGEGEKNGLSCILGERGIAKAAEADGVEPIGVALDKLAKGRLRVLSDELVKKFAVVHKSFHRYTPGGRGRLTVISSGE